MSGRAWKSWEDELTKEIVLKYRAEGKTMSQAFRHLESRLDNRTEAAISFCWNDRLAKEEGMAEKIIAADRKAHRLKSGKQLQRKKNWYQTNKAKVVTLPYDVVKEIDRIKEKDENTLFNLMELSTNPILSAFLSNAENTQLYFKALEIGYKPDKTKEEIVIDNIKQTIEKGQTQQTIGMRKVLEWLGHDDILNAVWEEEE